jgi:site-specific DNA recombinase
MTVPRDQRPICVCYCRVSTKAQGNDGLSMDNQEQRITEWCEKNQFIPWFFKDIASGKDSKRRPEFRKAVLQAKELGCPFIVYAASRLARNFTDMEWMLAEFEKSSAYMLSISESIDSRTSTGRTTLTVMMMVSKMFREQVVEQTQAAIDHLKRNGRKYARNPPFGFMWRDGKKVENPVEQRVLDAIAKMRLINPEIVPSQIAVQLNQMGLPTRCRKNKRQWTSKKVRHILSKYSDHEPEDIEEFKSTLADLQQQSPQPEQPEARQWKL